MLARAWLINRYLCRVVQLRREGVLVVVAEQGGKSGARRDRTADLMNAIHALSQLSYGPVPWKLETPF